MKRPSKPGVQQPSTRLGKRAGKAQRDTRSKAGAAGKRRGGAGKKAPRLSRTQIPAGMPVAEWQRGLRCQFGREQAFTLENLGDEAFFSEFRVDNPESRRHYRVAIRGTLPGENFCACPDFATNELGTCKHIEFVLARLERRRGAKAAFARGWHPPFSELFLRYGEQRSVHFRAGGDCPSPVRKAARPLLDRLEDGRVAEAHFDELPRLLSAAARPGHELRFYDDARAYVAGRCDALHREQALARAFPRGAADPRMAKVLKVPLYPYQAEGALFAVRAGRALIGDEMGLGKTAQAIAAMEILARHFGVGRVLVVCPTSLKYQWQSELARFAGRASRVITGGTVQRRKAFQDDDFCKITNYEKLQADLDTIAAWSPELVIVDEAQRIKNWNTIAARALKRIDSPYALVLTGTPLENKLEELISIVQFVDQFRLGPTWKLLHAHQVCDEAGRVIGYRGLDQVGRTLAPVMIRRRKAEVLQQLPSRSDQTLLVPMTEAQLAIHKENADTVARIVQRWRKSRFLSDSDQRRLTCALQNMRMACNSTYLLDQESDHGVKADELMVLLDDLCAQADGKAVIFSQWTRTHHIVARRLEARGIGFVSFHGGVPAEKRPQLVERFRADPQCRVFLSTDAGASGLNLQHASTIVNFDLPWNPALLEQRIGRVHRMGQKRPVRVINFVAKGTIEESMLSVLAFKRSLAAGILDSGESEVALGGSRLSRFMKEVEGVTGGIGDAAPVAADEEVSVQGAVESADAGAEADADAGTETRSDATPRRAAENAGDTLPSAGLADPTAATALLEAGTRLLAALLPPAIEAGRTPFEFERDAASGEESLRLRLPNAAAKNALADVLVALANALRSSER